METMRSQMPQRGLIGVASHFRSTYGRLLPTGRKNGWYETAKRMRAFRYATSRRISRVPKGTPITNGHYTSH